MLKSFSEYVSMYEKVEFKERFVKELDKLKEDKISKYLINYMNTNTDEYFDWVELADMFATNRLILTSKNNKPQVMKMTRFLRKILPLQLFSSDEIDKYVVKILNNQIENTYFEIWKGDKIKEAFFPNNFLIKDGELISSCMSKEECQNYFNIYTSNKNVAVLVLLHENKIIGRALVWKALYSDRARVQNVPYTVMDKIYAINELEEQKFIKYANDNDWLHFKEKGAYFVDKNNKGFYGEFVIKLENTDFQFYPYIDNMSYLDKENKTLSNRKGVFLLNNKDGSLPTCTTCQDNHQLLCPDCEGTGGLDGNSCKSCDGTSFIPCPDCTK